MLHKILANEYPAATDLGAGNLAGLGALAQFFWVHAQELRGLFEIQGVHHTIEGGCARAASTRADVERFAG